MKKQSAGILLYRFNIHAVEIFLVHPGGPFWKSKDDGAWTIPKGEFADDEQPLTAAVREFQEETGIELTGNFRALTSVKQKAGKLVHAWALEKDIDPTEIRSNTFEMEWPPRSGKMQSFPEIDKAAWFTIAEAKKKININQSAFIDELVGLLMLNDE